jgi:uncharacterized OB-fold protein
VTAAGVPVAEGLFTWPSDEPRLIGARCADCGVTTFPRQALCPRCTGDRMEESLLDRRGTLWTFTTQAFPPKSPPYIEPVDAADFEPYALGYLELAGQARVQGRIVGVPFAELRIGMALEVVVVPFAAREDGTPVLTYAFAPPAGSR